MHIRNLVKESHKTAILKGFWGNDNIPEKIMLIVTELSEAVEALRRNNRQPYKIAINEVTKRKNKFNVKIGKAKRVWSKDTFEDEIADTFIRLADLCGQMNIDVEWQLGEKMKYNKKREHLHGKEF